MACEKLRYLVGGELLGVSQQIELVVLPFLAEIIQTPYSELANWQAAGSFIFLFSSVFWTKVFTNKGCSLVIKVTSAGFIINLFLMSVWLVHADYLVELMLTLFILSRIMYGIFTSGVCLNPILVLCRFFQKLVLVFSKSQFRWHFSEVPHVNNIFRFIACVAGVGICACAYIECVCIIGNFGVTSL